MDRAWGVEGVWCIEHLEYMIIGGVVMIILITAYIGDIPSPGYLLMCRSSLSRHKLAETTYQS